MDTQGQQNMSLGGGGGGEGGGGWGAAEGGLTQSIQIMNGKMRWKYCIYMSCFCESFIV